MTVSGYLPDMPNDESPESLLDALQQGAVPHGAEASRSMGEESLDVIEALKGGSAEVAAPDATLGGYMKLHTRPAAFEGSDAQPYTVDVDTEETGRSGQEFAAFFVFLRWAETGAGIMTHLLSEDVGYGRSEERRVGKELGSRRTRDVVTHSSQCRTRAES